MLTLKERIAKIDRNRAERAISINNFPNDENAFHQKEDRLSNQHAVPAAVHDDDRVAMLPVGMQRAKNRRLNALRGSSLKRSNGSATERPKLTPHI